MNFPIYTISATSVDNQKLVDNVQNLSTQEKDEYQQLTKGIEPRIKAEECQAKELVQKVQQRVANQDLSKANDSSEEQIISLTQMLKDHQSITSYDVKQAERGLFIFISLSMPEIVLKNLNTLADQLGGRLVMRGLKDNSFKKTVEYIRHLQKQGIKVEIDPKLFEKFKVSLVPTFVLVDGGKVDILRGNVSLLHVLKEFSQRGHNPDLAKEYLVFLGP